MTLETNHGDGSLRQRSPSLSREEALDLWKAGERTVTSWGTNGRWPGAAAAVRVALSTSTAEHDEMEKTRSSRVLEVEKHPMAHGLMGGSDKSRSGWQDTSTPRDRHLESSPVDNVRYLESLHSPNQRATRLQVQVELPSLTLPLRTGHQASPRMFEKSRSGKFRPRSSKSAERRCRTVLLCVFFLLLLVFPTLQWLLSFPPPSYKRKMPRACKEKGSAYVLHKGAVCTDACGAVCFPRVQGLCLAHNQVTVCGKQSISWEERSAGGGLPMEMRFSVNGVARAKVPVRRGSCSGWDSSRKGLRTEWGVQDGRQVEWIRGTQMVADLKMMPYGANIGPNPHHEAEKLIPAILLSHLYGLNKSTLYWFADPADPSTLSRWSLGLAAAFSRELNVKFLNLPGPEDPSICFEDAILFSGVTNAGYMPNTEANDWLRGQVLSYCGIPSINAHRPLADVVVVKRRNSSRPIANLASVEEVLQRELLVPLKHAISGLGDFCEQVKVVAEADFLITPHGSHNINFLFARPEAIVFEAFPLLYYIDWFKNYVHATSVHHYELYGTWPSEEGGMPLKMRVFALLLGWKRCFSVRQCMNYSKSQPIFVDLEQLEFELHKLTTSCRLAVQGSWCLSDYAKKAGLTGIS